MHRQSYSVLILVKARIRHSYRPSMRTNAAAWISEERKKITGKYGNSSDAEKIHNTSQLTTYVAVWVWSTSEKSIYTAQSTDTHTAQIVCMQHASSQPTAQIKHVETCFPTFQLSAFYANAESDSRYLVTFLTFARRQFSYGFSCRSKWREQMEIYLEDFPWRGICWRGRQNAKKNSENATQMEWTSFCTIHFRMLLLVSTKNLSDGIYSHVHTLHTRRQTRHFNINSQKK